jgi:serine/threonine-protein kinase RsbW
MSPLERPALTFDRSVHADVRLLVSMRADLRAWLLSVGVRPTDCDAVVLACSEALANAIEHAYRGDPAGVVRITGLLRGELLEVAVSDTGSWVPPQPGRVRPGVVDSFDMDSPSGQIRGRGLALIQQLMDRSEVSTEGGTTISMRRRCVIMPGVHPVM